MSSRARHTRPLGSRTRLPTIRQLVLLWRLGSVGVGVDVDDLIEALEGREGMVLVNAGRRGDPALAKFAMIHVRRTERLERALLACFEASPGKDLDELLDQLAPIENQEQPHE